MRTHLCLTIISAVGLQGCAGSANTSASAPLASAGTTTMLGDLDDLDAAVEVGAGQAECVIVSVSSAVISDTPAVQGAVVRRFELRHVSGRTVVLELYNTQPAITARCTVFPLSDPKLERQILDRVRVRLSDLRGKEFAPIRE